MRNFKEYDVVIALKTLKGIPAGTKGVILTANDNIDYYIVEFVDNNNTTDTIEVSGSDITLMDE